jgi:2-keto-4-pentenoate hydratase
MSSTPKTKVPTQLQTDLAALLQKSISRGFVTQEEVLDVVIEPELYIELLDEFYGQILQNNVDIFESVSEEQTDDSMNEIQRELELLTSLDGKVGTDPLFLRLC